MDSAARVGFCWIVELVDAWARKVRGPAHRREKVAANVGVGRHEGLTSWRAAVFPRLVDLEPAEVGAVEAVADRATARRPGPKKAT